MDDEKLIGVIVSISLAYFIQDTPSVQDGGVRDIHFFTGCCYG